MSIEALRQEYFREIIGEKILDLLARLTRNVTREYDPVVYGNAKSWDEAHEDVLHSFIAEVLLEQGQLEYAIFNAETEEYFLNLLARQLRRFLARNRRRTVVDNLLKRCKKITSKVPFRQESDTKSWWYELNDKATSDRFPSADEIARVACELAAVPIQLSSSTERASQIYSTSDLKKILFHMATTTACRISVGNLDHLFRRLLTPWLPRFLEKDEGNSAVHEELDLNPEQENMARQAAHAIVEAGTPLELGILAMKIADISDSAIARRFEISRPTVIKHKKKVFSKVENELKTLDEKCQKQAIELLTALIQEKNDAH